MPSPPAQEHRLSPAIFNQTHSPSVAHSVQPRFAHLQSKIAALETQIEETTAKLDDAAAQLKNPDPHRTVSNHIRLLRNYNDIRDIGTSLMGLIANNRQVPMKRVYQDFHVDEKD